MTKFRNMEALLGATPVMPIVTIAAADLAADLARALVRGGIHAIEVTMRTPAALAAMEAIARAVPEITVGAGTVLTADDMRRAAAAGATFAISPGTTPELLAAGCEEILPYLPGVATAGEIQGAMDFGYGCFKFFPAAGAGGIAALRAFAAPFPRLRFCATGGITPETAQSYLDLPNVLSIGGSWIAPAELIAKKDWSAIEARAHDAAKCFKRKSSR
ncbi:MAG TPA: bifunctional 4-hydroxy-2-oxoglutarate aldolase/2-dehydro-3-deoxy-phosphogluconate aldolase [Steroidobacteraceae bacterium]